MWPRFKPGGRIAISPRSPVAIGDDVIVRLRSSEVGQPVLIKALVRRSNGGIELRQFNPDLAFIVGDDQIDAVHKVVGELI
jgi:phage repressor protein C with HTH and peptisase S24 domain